MTDLGEQNQTIKENKMGVMPVGKLVISMSLPSILSMIIQALYNVVDTIFVSRLGEAGITALTLVNPIQMLMIAVGAGTGIGINSLISRRLGAKRFEEANSAASNGLLLALINGVFFAFIGIFLSGPFIRLFTDDPVIIEGGITYMTIVTVFSVFIMVQLNAEKILQATGVMVLAMISTITGAVINIILNPILIFGLLGAPAMGIAGSATATVTGQFVGMVMSVTLLYKKNKIVKVRLKSKFNGRTVKEIYSVALPAILMQSINSIMLFGMNGILAGFSSTAIAVMGVYGRLQSFIFMPVFGINQGSMPILGYNYGARYKERLMGAYKVALIMALSIMFIGLVLFQTIPGQLLGLFNASPEMVEMGVPALRAISLCFLPAAFGIISSGMFNATGHGLISLVGSLIRQLVGILPLAYILGQIGGVRLVWWSFPLAEILGLLYVFIMMRRFYKKEVTVLDRQV